MFGDLIKKKKEERYFRIVFPDNKTAEILFERKIIKLSKGTFSSKDIILIAKIANKKYGDYPFYEKERDNGTKIWRCEDGWAFEFHEADLT